ncbi:hypothetical protein ABVB69_36710 [Streptomyces sp. NPDC000349]|uniref:hypothetical protein n=1 Tax=Streptomyces sp. NPDC000349 TaxID=3154249 RepID=UPI00336A21DA
MGPHHIHEERPTRLRKAGLTGHEPDRLRSPIGLDLGARTPPRRPRCRSRSRPSPTGTAAPGQPCAPACPSAAPASRQRAPLPTSQESR